MIKVLVAAGRLSLRGMLCNKDTKTVVLPEPVGMDTPILVIPLFSASMHASMQVFW